MAIDWTTIEIESFFELYKITYLSQAWYYTSADHEIIYDGHTYSPAAIEHGDIIKESELNKIELDVTFPTSDLFKQYVATAPVYQTLVNIYLYQDASNVILAFQGEVTKISLNQTNTCIVRLDEYTSLTTKLPRLLISPACNHVLFDSGCGLTKASWKKTILVDTVNPGFIQSASLGAYPDGYFTQGVAEFQSDLRMITYHAGTMANLHIDFPTLHNGDTLYCYPGCDKSPATCDTKFSNLARYLGCPYVPRKNPVLFGI